jgi:AhpD family alkylhydroperoxidase
MPDWNPVPPDRPYAWPIRLLFALLRRSPGGVSESVRLWGRTPAVFLAFLGMNRALERRASPLEPGLRALIRVRISQINVCPFCVDLNASHALARNISEEKLMDLENHADSPLFDAREKAALAFAEAMTITGREVGPALRERLEAAFDGGALVELAGLVAFQNLSSKFNSAFGVRPEGYCRIKAPGGEAIQQAGDAAR